MSELKPGDRVRINRPGKSFHGKVGVITTPHDDYDASRWPLWVTIDGGGTVGMHGNELERVPVQAQIVCVVTADYGLNGHEILGVFRTDPDDKVPDAYALAKARGCAGITGFSGIEINMMAVETR